MKNTTITDLRVVLTIDGEEYQFLNVRQLDTSDPRTMSLIGSPQGLTNGLVQEEGVSAEVTKAIQVYEVPSDVALIIYKAWDKKKRINLKQWGSVSRESETCTQGIIKTSPYNGTIQEGEPVDLMLNLGFVRNNVKPGTL